MKKSFFLASVIAISFFLYACEPGANDRNGAPGEDETTTTNGYQEEPNGAVRDRTDEGVMPGDTVERFEGTTGGYGTEGTTGGSGTQGTTGGSGTQGTTQGGGSETEGYGTPEGSQGTTGGHSGHGGATGGATGQDTIGSQGTTGGNK
ncbi:MAG: hypothetical protein H0V01_07505 [Bacteroidetes bacterium]|nr:hypothetical protein [Bacteroidota bacterium]HET6244206.1 hypothetical protein [Bacteroidia bacterium]